MIRDYYDALGVEVLRTNGSEATARCFANPDAHKSGWDKNPSMDVNLANGLWNCHACGAGGNPYQAAIALGRSPAEAMGLLERFGLTDPNRNGKPEHAEKVKARELPSGQQLAHWHRALLGNPKLTERLYELRRWTPEAIERLAVGFDSERIVFPIHDGHSSLVGLVRYHPNPAERNGAKKSLADKDSTRDLFPAAETLTGGEAFLVEGEADAVAAHSIGLPAVSVPGVKGWRPEWATRFTGKRVTVIADCDKQGRGLAQEVAGDLLPHAAEVRVLDLDPARDDGYDLGDLVRDAENREELPQVGNLVRELAAKVGLFEAAKPEPPEPTSEKPHTTKLRALDVKRILSEPPPEVDWRVKPILAEGGLSMLFAPPGEGKSLLAGTLTAAACHGESVAGFTTQRSEVVYIDAENGEWEIARRIHSLGVPPDGFRVYEADGFDLRHHGDELEAIVGDAQIVVLDSLRSLAPGLDENDSGQCEAALGPLRRLAHGQQKAVLLIHHANKGGKAYRGSSAILAAVDITFALGRAEGDPMGCRRYLACHKMRVGPEPERRWLSLSAEGGMVLIGEAEPFETEEPRPTASVSEQLTPQIETVIASKRLHLADVARAVGRDPKDRTVRRVLEHLQREERANKDNDGFWQGVMVSPPDTLGGVTRDTISTNPLVERDSEGVTQGVTQYLVTPFDTPPKLAENPPLATPEQEAEAERLLEKFGGDRA